MNRAILDANIVIGGWFDNPKTPGKVISRLFLRHYQSITSESMLAEIAKGWSNRYWSARLSPTSVHEAIGLFRSMSTVVEIAGSLKHVAPHRQDDHVLEAAVVGQCDYIVTGDKELREMGEFGGIQIVTPEVFLVVLDASAP